MNSNQMDSTITVLASFATGAALGAGLALLYAPKSGRELRGEIADLSKDLAEKVKDFSKDAQEQIKHIINEGRESISEQKAIFSSAIEAGKEAMQKEKQRLNSEV